MRSNEIFNYFFSAKIEKDEYINFLNSIILYAKKQSDFLNLVEDIDNDINAIKQNNVSAKYVVDKYLLLIK